MPRGQLRKARVLAGLTHRIRDPSPSSSDLLLGSCRAVAFGLMFDLGIEFCAEWGAARIIETPG
jgi:hypothetical protein